MSEEGWHSLVWTKGSAGLRFRLREGEFEVNEYEPGPDGKPRSTRLVIGSFEFCLVMAEKWFARLSGPEAGAARPGATSEPATGARPETTRLAGPGGSSGGFR